MGNREADFSQGIKLTIAYLCKYRCSNPNCRKDTMRENSGGEMFSIGRAAHIEAASAGGPRYNPNSTLEYRKSIENAIWLCPTCADIVDKDENAYSTELLKEWKRKAEEKIEIKGVRIIAVANDTGGVGTSSVAAYLSKALASITNELILCISVNAYDHAGAILFNYADENIYSQKKTIISNQKKVDYMCDCASEELFVKGVSKYKKELRELIKEKAYRYVIVDCGNSSFRTQEILLELATDLVIPIGDHSYTDIGIIKIMDCFKYRDERILVWPMFSKGLTISNKSYRRVWFRKICKALNGIGKLKNVTINNTGIIIPNSHYVCNVNDIFECKKTEHVATAYLDFVNELLEMQ